MKRLPLIVLALGSCIILTVTLTPNLSANVQPQNAATYFSTLSVKYPAGETFVTPVDPDGTSKPQLAGEADLISRFIAPDTVWRHLIAIDEHWIVLKEGKNEHWVPLHKAILLPVSL